MQYIKDKILKVTRNKNSLLILILLWTSATLIRSYAVSNYNFPYWFDLGRDAIISREIIENNDLKIQGPSASGTNDTVFHGVLYYYFIGPLYTIFNGDPQKVLYIVIALSSSGVVPFYLLSKSITKSKKVAILSSIFYIFSFELFKVTTWLSNPVIASASLPTFFYLYWLVFFEKKRKYLPPLLLSLAITHQAAILFAPWWILIFIGFLIEYNDKNIKKWSIKNIFLSLFSYLIGVSTMILTQIKLWRAGIFSVSSLSSFSHIEQINSMKSINTILIQYYSKIIDSIVPSMPIFSLILFIFLIIYAYKKMSFKVNTYLLLIVFSPLLLLSWHSRISYHSLMTLEFFIYLLFAVLIKNICKIKAGKIISTLLIMLFIFSNLSAYKQANEYKLSEYFVPQGAYLSDLIDVIDYTYVQANGENFSISTITNPYGYNTLWAYLYSWYGENTYGYTPEWYGPDQTGLFGDTLLNRTTSPKNLHFSIREPHEGMPIWLYENFDHEQSLVASPSAKLLFGTIDVKKHIVY